MFEVRVETNFSSAHHLLNYKGKCENMHGHNWKVEVTARGNNLDNSNILVDFKTLNTRLIWNPEITTRKFKENVSKYWNVSETPWTVSPYERFLLSLHGINVEDMIMSPVLSNLYYDSYIDFLNQIRKCVENPDQYAIRNVNVYFSTENIV